MAGRLGIDFGTSNTVVAAWDDLTGEATTVRVPDYGRLFSHAGQQVPVVPSLIHYSDDGRLRLGDQVLAGNLYDAAGTFRWMKRYIMNRNTSLVRAAGRRIPHAEAGRDFLSTVLAFATLETGTQGEEVALTVPVDSYEHYENWVAEVAEAAGMPRFRLIDEPSAAALGYGAHIQPDQVYLLFDFGGGTMQAAVVKVLDADERTTVGRPCRVLGKADEHIGGSTIDQWIFSEVLSRNGRHDSDDEVRALSRSLLVECERAKEALTDRDRASVSAMNPRTGATLGIDLVRSGPSDTGSPDGPVSFEDLLDRHELFATINRVVRTALRRAGDRGFDADDVDAVLMVGGSSLIPSVQRTLAQTFGRERVRSDRPLDAVARGAAALAAGVGFYDHIQHDYAIRWYDRSTGQYQYRPCVESGTPYPTEGAVTTVTVKATHDGQRELGIAVFELGAQRRDDGVSELVLDPSGAWRVVTLTPDDLEDRSRFWVNEQNQTFLVAEPPATSGQARFRVEFGIDGNKRLLLTAHDLVRGVTTHRDHPVVKLT